MENPITRVTIKQWGRKISAELPHSDVDINDLMELIVSVVRASGFSENTINEWIAEYAQEIDSDLPKSD